MKSKTSLIAFVALLLLIGGAVATLPRVGLGQGVRHNTPNSGPRKFYLTQTEHAGNNAITACAEGYHMATMYEIIDPSNFKYDTQLGRTSADSGFGPPTNRSGWIRTGMLVPNGGDVPGIANCNTWTSAVTEDHGTTAFLNSEFNDPPVPWRTATGLCSGSFNVWCVQD